MDLDPTGGVRGRELHSSLKLDGGRLSIGLSRSGKLCCTSWRETDKGPIILGWVGVCWAEMAFINNVASRRLRD